MMFAFLLRLLLILLLVRAVWRLFGGIVEGSVERSARMPEPPPAVPLERDPVCGTFVVRSRALTSTGGDGVKYFCSERCRRMYAERRAAG